MSRKRTNNKGFDPSMANYGGRHSIVKQHHSHAQQIAKIQNRAPKVFRAPPRSRGGSPTSPSLRSFPPDDMYAPSQLYNARKVTASHWTLEDRSSPTHQRELRLPKTGSKPGYREIMASSSSPFLRPHTSSGGSPSGSSIGPATSLGSRTSNVQAYIDYGMQNGGMAQTYLDASKPPRPELRIFRHNFPEEFNQTYAQFLSMLSVMDRNTMMQVVDNAWRDATENRNRPWILDSFKAHQTLVGREVSAAGPEQHGGGADGGQVSRGGGGGRDGTPPPSGSVEAEASDASSAVPAPPPPGGVGPDGKPLKIIRPGTKRAENFYQRIMRCDFEPEELLRIVSNQAEQPVRDRALTQSYGEYKMYKTVMDFNAKVSQELDLHSAIRMIVSEVCEVLDCDQASLFMVNHHTEELINEDISPPIRVPIGKGIVGEVAKTGELINISDAYSDKRFNKEVDKKTGMRTKTMLTFPIIESNDGHRSSTDGGRGGRYRGVSGSARDVMASGGKKGKGSQRRVVVAVLQAINKREGVFTSEDEAMMHAIGGQTAMTLTNAASHANTKKARQKVRALLDVSEQLAKAGDIDSTIATASVFCFFL